MATTSAYNTPRVLGQVYNTVSYRPQEQAAAEWYTCTDIITTPKAPSVIDGTVTVIGTAANPKITFDASTGIIRFSDAAFNGHLTCSITVTTSSIPDGPAGNTFTYTVSVFTIGIGLPYFTGDHVLNYRVGDYVNFTLKPAARTHKEPSAIQFDVSGDMVPTGQHNTWTLENSEESGIVAHKYNNDDPSDDGIQTIKFYGYARQPGLYRFTLTGVATVGGNDPGTTILGGEADSESFLVNIRPYGPQPGQLYAVVTDPGMVKNRGPVYRFAAMDSPDKDTDDALAYILTHAAPDDLNFTFHSNKWDGKQPVQPGDPAVNTSEHRPGYWTLELVNNANTGASPIHYYFTLSCANDIWYLYHANSHQQSTWVVIASAPTQYPNTILYPPYFLAAASGNRYCANFYAKGAQNYHVEGYGTFSYTGDFSNHRIYAQEPVLTNWPNPNPVHVASTAHNYILHCLSSDESSPNSRWILLPSANASQSSAIAVLPGSVIQPNKAVAILYAVPRKNQNHGGEVSKDVVFSVACSEDGNFTFAASMSDYAHVSQLPGFGNNAGTGEDTNNGVGKFVWAVENTGSDDGTPTAGYMWTSYYSLLRFINFNTAKLYLSVGGQSSIKTEVVDSSVTSSCMGGESFPTTPGSYYVLSGGVPKLYTNMSRSSSSENTKVEVTRDYSWDCSNVSGAFNAWTGNLGYFKLAGWSPGLPAGTLSASYKETTNRSEIKEELGLALLDNREVKIMNTSESEVTTRRVKLSDLYNWIPGAGIGSGAIHTLSDTVTYTCDYVSGGGCRGRSCREVVELTDPVYRENTCLPNYDANTTLYYWFENGGAAPDIIDTTYHGVGGGGVAGGTVSYNGCYVSAEITCLINGSNVSNESTSGSVVVQGYWEDMSEEAAENYERWRMRVTLFVALKHEDGDLITPQTTRTYEECTDLSENPFQNRYTANIDACSLCVSWDPQYTSPPDPTCSALGTTGSATVKKTVTINNAEYSVKVTGGSVDRKISGSTVVSGIVATPNSGGCYDYKTLVGWVAEGTTKTYQATADIQYAAGMNKTDDVNGAWFSANVEVSDGPPVSGGLWRALYLTAAGCGHTNVAGGGNYQQVLNYTTRTVTTAQSLVYSGGSYTIVSSGGDTSITDSTVTPVAVAASIGCGYACRGGLLQITGALDSGAKTLTGTKSCTDVVYAGEASLIEGDADPIALDFAEGAAHSATSAFNNGGIRADHSTESIAVGDLNGTPITGPNVVNEVKNAVAAVEQPSAIEGGWSGGVAYGSTLIYARHEETTTNKHRNTYKIGLELHS